MGKIVMIRDDYHNIGRLLLPMIIVNSNNIDYCRRKYHG